jgi:hypothetical protein
MVTILARAGAVRWVVAVLAAFAAMQVSVAHAAILDWSFTIADGQTGIGTFSADQDAIDPAVFHLTSATGTIDGESVTLSTYDGASNNAYPGSAFLIDSGGIGFFTASGYYNLYEYFPGLISEIYDCGANYCIEGPSEFDATAENLRAVRDLSITVRDVPEPSTWSLMLLGFGGLGAAMRRRRKVAAA